MAKKISELPPASALSGSEMLEIVQAMASKRATIADLLALVPNLYKGLYTSIGALNTAHPTSVPGAFADVDSGAGANVQRYIWDNSDNAWVLQAGGSQATSTVTGLPSRDVTASGAVTPTDAGKWLICTSASPITLTIGAEATAAWTTSGILPMFHILQIGAGAVTVTGDGFSVTLHAGDTNVLDGAGAAATALWRASNTWSLIGRLVAA